MVSKLGMGGGILAVLAAVLVAAVGMAPDPGNGTEVLFAPTGNERLIQKRIVRELAAAKKKVVVAIYQFTSKDIAAALVHAKRRGVDVRILIDSTQAGKLEGSWGEALQSIEEAKIPIRRITPEGRNKDHKFEAMRPKFHHKFCVIDGEKVLTGSYNWTILADEDNHENLVVLSGAAVAARFGDQFEKIWKDERILEQ